MYHPPKTKDMGRQIATDMSQSDRLLRCGVSADTADMCYQFIDECVNNTDKPICSTPKEQFDTIRGYGFGNSRIHITPAWSLSALLSDILPMKITDGDGCDYELQLSANISEDDCHRWELSYYSSLLEVALMYVETPNPIEAAVQMIEQLTNNGYNLNEQ